MLLCVCGLDTHMYSLPLAKSCWAHWIRCGSSDRCWYSQSAAPLSATHYHCASDPVRLSSKNDFGRILIHSRRSSIYQMSKCSIYPTSMTCEGNKKNTRDAMLSETFKMPILLNECRIPSCPMPCRLQLCGIGAPVRCLATL